MTSPQTTRNASSAWARRIRRFAPDIARIIEGSFGEPAAGIAGELGTGLSGPLIHSLLHWIDKTAQADGIDRLWFAAREGQLLAKCATVLGLKTPVQYLPVSRQALSRCLYRTPSEGEPLPSWILDSLEATPRAILLNLGLAPEEWLAELVATGFLRTRWDVPHRWSSEEVHALSAFLRLPPVARCLEERTRMSARNALRLFAALGLQSGQHVGFVDLGWRGTLQHVWERLLSESEVSVRVTGYYLALDENRHGLDIRAQEYLPSGEEHYLRPFHAAVEMLLPADHGQVTDYSAEGPVFAPFTALPQETIAALQSGALDYCRTASQRKVPPLGSLRRLLEEFLLRPEDPHARLISTARFNSGVTAGVSLVQPFLAGRRSLSDRLRQGPFSWPAGWATQALPWIPRWMRHTIARVLLWCWQLGHRLKSRGDR